MLVVERKKKEKKTGLKIFDFPLRIIEKNGLSLSCSKYEFPFSILRGDSPRSLAMENSSNDCYGMHNTRNSTRYIYKRHDTTPTACREEGIPGIIYGSCEQARREREEGDVESR